MKRSKHQQRELTEEERNVVVVVRHCAGELNDILQGARRKVQSNAKLFAETGVSVMFRGIDSYADMHEKLKLKSREALDRLFTKFVECEEVQDAEDAIEETEGNWRNFLTNLDHEVSPFVAPLKSDSKGAEVDSPSSLPKVLYFKPAAHPLIDTHTNKEVSLGQYLVEKTCVLVTFQPAYWPDTCIRWRHSEVSKVKADLTQFAVGNVIVTWGPPDEVRTWSKQVAKITKWPVLWDKQGTLCSFLEFHCGLQRIWAAETLNFLGSQRAAHAWPVPRPPPDLNWLTWRRIGGEAMICQPVSWKPESVTQTDPDKSDAEGGTTTVGMKRPNSESDDDDTERNDTVPTKQALSDLERESLADLKAMKSGELKVCFIHRSAHLAELAPSGMVYQAALTCYARLHQTTEALVMDRIRKNRRFTTAPESARLQYEFTTGLYYDPETALYYDSARGYFYDATDRMYYYWSQAEHRYIQANALIQAELAAAHVAQAAAAQAAITRAAAEREAARQAALRVAAQLAEIRANKDDYAAYAYATCVLPQQELDGIGNPLQAEYRNTAAAASTIERSLQVYGSAGTKDTAVHSSESISVTKDTRLSSTPPPPGL